MIWTPRKPKVESPNCPKCGGMRRQYARANRRRLGIGGLLATCCCPDGCTCDCGTNPSTITATPSGITVCNKSGNCWGDCPGESSPLSFEISEDLENDTYSMTEDSSLSGCYADATLYGSCDALEYQTADCTEDSACAQPLTRGTLWCKGGNTWAFSIVAGFGLSGGGTYYLVLFYATFTSNPCGTTLVIGNELESADCCDGSGRTTLAGVGRSCSALTEDIDIGGYGGTVTLESTCP